MNKLLVTGATGFIGKSVFRFLPETLYEIHGVTSRRIADIEPSVDNQIIWHEADLLNDKSVSALIQRVQPTHLLHLAWDVTPGLYWNAPSNLQWVQSSLHLVQEFAEQGGKRAVMAGTCTEYDWSQGQYCVEGQTPCVPHTLYGCSKFALQTLLSKYAEKIGLSAAWGRIFFLYGPGEYEARLVPSVIRSLLQGQIARCSHGRQIRDFLHVEDVAYAFASLVDSDVEGPVNIASGRPIALSEMIYAIAEKLGRNDLVHLGAIEASPDEPPLLVADTRKLNQQVGWQPQYALDQGLEHTIDWWRQQQNL